MWSLQAHYILAALAILFLLLGAARGWRHPQGRTWLTVGAIFAAVALWLFYSAAYALRDWMDPKQSAFAGGRERGAPPIARRVPVDSLSSRRGLVGLFADRTRRGVSVSIASRET